MLFKNDVLKRLADGSVTTAFRCWKKARINEGTKLRTPVGVLEIQSVEVVAEEERLTAEDAGRAGYVSLAELRKELNRYRGKGNVYRIELRYAGSDPREMLWEQDELTDAEVDELKRRLQRYDKASRRGPWTLQTMLLIQELSGSRAAELADRMAWEPDALKINVRKLKELGLTISLGTGYKLSSRGIRLLKHLQP
ncbi:hypothetical protein SAMN04487970_1004157 [Paenibacillus tianmuensis]|uniref:ASCH domain-containing protein n=1 Tax=Paenibacillus tianmuensis TaxID=624147 RepID=A0A1G4PXI3_9BACL|nr:ASCH domain-containing protein [Paenibacillus tianmuensis]SCW37023.1 hypothetical protein SAMN04487970_1004157 [Paenibacillus tianmuensis]